MEGYARCLESKRIEWDEGRNVDQMWEQVKGAMVGSAKEVCDSVRVEGKNPKNVWWNDMVKAAVKRMETVWKEVLGVRDEVAKNRCMEVYKRKIEKLKGVFVRAKRRGINTLEGI